ncbi:hypothetical protein [Micropruina sp.]|uniref:hypothetical protein n=1 Tax=Micropruina sp. TaxID=2737536 RepID=UPI0039E241F5
MPVPDLIDPPLEGFDAAAVKAAAGRVRAECHWHIAPEFTQTFVCETPRDGIVDLPTLHLVSVESVTVDGQPVAFDWSVSGRVVLPGLPSGASLRSLVIVARHGFEACPQSLRGVVAELAAPGLGGGKARSEVTGPFTDSYFESDDAAEVLAAYRLPVVA